MFLFKRWKSTLIGFLTCTIVIVCLMLILWATIDVQAVIDANTALVEQAGAAGHLWVILLMLVVVRDCNTCIFGAVISIIKDSVLLITPLSFFDIKVIL